MSHGPPLPVAATPSPATPSPHRWTVLVLLTLAQFMLIIDTTVVQVALPSIGAELQLDREALTWVVTTYTLTFGSLMVLGGRLADTFGAQRMLVTGLILFTVASLACGLAANGDLLIAGRAGQGVGAALMSPSALAIILANFHGRERHRALGVWAGVGGMGAAAGVLLSGLLTAGPGWEWAFLVNVPVGLVVLAAVPAVVDTDITRARQRVDLPGALLVTAATALLLYGLTSAGDTGWTGRATVVALGAAVALYAVFLTTERHVTRPLVRPAMLAHRPVISGVVLMLLGTGLMFGLFFLTSLYLQHTLRFSALRTGLLFLPVAVAVTVGAQVSGRLISRVGGRVVASVGFAMTATGTLLLTQLSPTGNVHTGLLPGLVLAALGIGPIFVTATTTTLANVPAGEAGVASGVVNTAHELGGGIGVAVISTVAASSLTGIGMNGFTTGFAVSAAVAAVALVVSACLVPPGKPAGAAGHGHGH